MSKDITGIKKLKVERVKNEEQHEKQLVTQLSRQFSVDHFVDKMPEKDSAGNPIPPWKRQMLAKKAADKARKEMEEQLAREAEDKRLQSIPAWKRHLMQRKQDTPPSRPSSVQHFAPMPPPISEDKKITSEIKSEPSPAAVINNDNNNLETPDNKENNKPEPMVKSDDAKQTNNNSYDEDATTIIPWRAQLRKTNSTLNLLE
ncbi:hypothetical protein AAG570_006183 [Ranatra chinensis]|uniref:Espin n=1 Tax=Ranatra chinensis TaxID=642074 RepID=A0ABD0YFQ2_9HEMI